MSNSNHHNQLIVSPTGIIPSGITVTSASLSDHSNISSTRMNYPFPDTSLIGQNLAGFVGIYSPEQRKQRIERFMQKRQSRVWTKKVKYDVRKNFADSRLRVKVS